ncbi:MAG: sulfatase [Rikenellaceae bacterium]
MNLKQLNLIAFTSVAALGYAEQRPNIIMIVTDDHGLDAVGCYGNPVIKTPNIDKLAAEGTRFTNAYCTSASSAASRSVILTGQYGHAIGAYGHTHDYHHFSTFDGVRTLPVMLAEGGYTTARIGKYHVAPESVYHFDATLDADPRNTVEMADACKDVLNSEEPFFLYFCPDDPHRSDFTDASREWSLPNMFGNKREGYKGVETVSYSTDEVIVPPFLPDNRYTREELAEYYQSISRIDQGVGRLMKHLEDSGKSDNTIVLYMSDNGMAFPTAKTTVYEMGIKLPFIVKDPTSKGVGVVNESMVSWVDLTPTILDFAGIDRSKESLHGVSFSSLIGNSKAGERKEVYASHTFHEITMYYPMRSIREGNYKLIWNVAWQLEYPFASDLWVSSTWQGVHRAGGKYFGNRKCSDFLFRPEFELYDVVNDPFESTNLAGKKGYKEELEQLKTKLKAWQRETRDPWFIMWEYDLTMQGSGEKL